MYVCMQDKGAPKLFFVQVVLYVLLATLSMPTILISLVLTQQLYGGHFIDLIGKFHPKRRVYFRVKFECSPILDYFI